MVPDGPVKAVLQVGDTLYVGGYFTRFAPPSGSVLAVDAARGRRHAFPPVTGGPAEAIVSDGEGGWYIGGSFTAVGGLPRAELAHVRTDGSVDPDWAPSVEGGAVEALALRGPTLYVGGSFRKLAGRARTGLGAVDAATGALLPWTAHLGLPSELAQALDATATVHVMAAAGRTLFVGGNFATVAGRRHAALAALDAGTGAVLPWGARIAVDACLGSGMCTQTPDVTALARVGSTLYAGGFFDHAGGKQRWLAAALDVGTGVATAWQPALGPHDESTSVTALAVAPPHVALAIDTAGTPRPAWLTIVDDRAGHTLRKIGTPATALAVSGGVLYVGGQGTALAVDLESGKRAAWRPPQPNGAVDAISVANGTVCFGGRFVSAGGIVRNGLAALDATTGAVRPWAPATRFPVSSLASDGRRLFAGGAEELRVAAFDLATGALLKWTSPGLRCPDAEGLCVVDALAVSGRTLFVGGEFTLRGRGGRGLVAVDALTGQVRPWNLSARGTNVPLYPEIDALVVSGRKLWVGGDFSSIAGAPRASLAVVDTETGKLLEGTPRVRSSDRGAPVVNAVAVTPSAVYLGGRFDLVGESQRGSLAALDPATGRVLPWRADVLKEAISEVGALATASGVVYVGGRFSSISGASRSAIAAVGAGDGAALPWQAELDGDSSGFALGPEVTSIAAADGRVWFGGDFLGVDGGAQAFLSASAG